MYARFSTQATKTLPRRAVLSHTANPGAARPVLQVRFLTFHAPPEFAAQRAAARPGSWLLYRSHRQNFRRLQDRHPNIGHYRELFRISRHYLCDGHKMQETAATFVLGSEAIDHHAMPDATAIPAVPAAAPSAPIPAVHSDAPDEHLMLALRDGSEPAFTILFSRYKQAIFGFFRRRIADPARAEELTQETFVALFRAARRYEPRALFRTYLYAIAFRILRTDRRQSQFRALFSGATSQAESAVTKNRTENELWVRHALKKLDPTDREIVMLREYQQLSYAEIATLLNMPLNTVRSRLFRGREALRDLLVPPQNVRTGSAGRVPLGPADFPAPRPGDEEKPPRKGQR
jgi:RNA polymerase sigma-70 factor, ECF subfamily